MVDSGITFLLRMLGILFPWWYLLHKNFASFLKAESCPMCIYATLFVHSSDTRHLSCFYFLVIMDIAAMNVGVRVSLLNTAFTYFSIYSGVILLGNIPALFLIF